MSGGRTMGVTTAFNVMLDIPGARGTWVTITPAGIMVGLWGLTVDHGSYVRVRA